MEIAIITDHITKDDLRLIAVRQFGDFVKAVVDIREGIMAIAGELHADEEAILLQHGSAQEDLWGINLYPDKAGAGFVEFNSMINIRPSRGNASRGVESPETQEKIRETIRKLVRE